MATRESDRSERVEDAPESSTESHPKAQLDRVENVDDHDSLPASLTQTMPKQCTGPEGNTLPSKEVTQLTSDLNAIGVHVQSGSGDSNLRATLSCISQAGRVTDSDKTVGSAADGIKKLFKDVELLKGSVPSDGVVGLYFSAHWCPPCRAFTPKLAETYNNIKKVGDKVFEIVFISSDKDQAQFDSYFAEMPWLAVPFEQSGLRTQLSNKFEVGGIPTLVLLNAKTGTVITADGRAALSRDPAGENYPWADAAEPAKTSPAAPGPAAPGKLHLPAKSGARAVRISPGTQVAMQLPMLLPMVCCATVFALIFSLPYLVVAAVKGPGTEFCGGYWQNSTATSMPASLGGRVRAAPMKRSQRLALRLTAPRPRGPCRQSIIQVWCFVTGCTFVPLPAVIIATTVAAASGHEAAAAGLSCFLCLYQIFCFSWWICGNVWCADLPQRRCFCSDPAILCPTVPRRASAPSCLSIASVFVARRIPRSEVLRVVPGSRAGPGGPPDRRICDAMRRYGHEKHLKAAEPASRICDAPTHRLWQQTLLEPATQRAKQLATLVASEQGASTLQLLGSVLSMSTVTGALAGSPGSATGGLVRGPGSATGGLQMRSEAAFGGDSFGEMERMCGGDFAGAGWGERGVTEGSAALSVDLFTDYHCYGLIIVVVLIIIASAPDFDRATLPQGTGPWVRAGCLQKW